MPHSRGSGPLLAGEAIVIDVFPRDNTSGYYFDMTRTVVKGTPRSEIVKLIGAVKRAHGDALAVVAPGKASGVHKAAVDSFTRSGYVTDEKGGFIHSLGHGLGLDLHESPRVGATSNDVLVVGDVITIEPGLYYPGVGGARIEDTVLVTKTGCVNLTNLPKTFFVK
jgi:Xaa-Pro aminopeptidase